MRKIASASAIKNVDKHSQMVYDYAKSNPGYACMYICICKNITDRQIRKAVLEQRVGNMRELRSCLGACDQCGKCAVAAREILRESGKERRILESSPAKAA